MDDGLYESLVNEQLQRELQSAAHLVSVIGHVDNADQPLVFARYVRAALERKLTLTRDPSARIALVNALLSDIAHAEEAVAPPARQLLSLSPPPGPGIVAREETRPRTPLSDSALLTNARGEPSLGGELRAEIGSTDGIDLLCAFVKWHGVRLLEAQLLAARRRSVPFRVITTTYMGATERRALDRLVGEFGAEVKIQYDALNTRLHAKAWLFRRNTRFDTAYVGSSNLSQAALLEGLEWNVRLSRVSNGHLLEQFAATFDSYWNDPSFETYDPETDADRLDAALRRAGGFVPTGPDLVVEMGLRPLAHQSEMLEDLWAERAVHDRHRNLLVAATGTGKTVIAALDYLSMCGPSAVDRPTLLFVAHRREILQQSLRTYRAALKDPNFGEQFHGTQRPTSWRHVFASVQSLHSYGVERIPPDAFDIVVIDEFHHAEAATYSSLLEHLRPKEMLGLTATPERTDGRDVRDLFDGRIAAELRLWDALGADLLCPFHYFGLADGTDLSTVAWRRGSYDQGDLSNLYTGNDARARIILARISDKLVDVSSMRGLGFCVSIAHAEYMARVFNRAGIPARAVSGVTKPAERSLAISDLRARQVNILFTADLFNEGIDIPEVDTILFLRPTESATVFLQQLGRGLRRSPEKAVLTVLDFVGLQRKDFRFDVRYRALTGVPRGQLERSVRENFPMLPSGCQVILDEQTQASVLENIRGQISYRWQSLVAELRSRPTDSLAEFIATSGIELADIVRSDRSWTRLRRAAGLVSSPESAVETRLLKRARALAHVDDPVRARGYRRLLADDAPRFSQLEGDEIALARMLLFSIWPTAGFGTFDEGLRALHGQKALRDDLNQVIDIAFEGARSTPIELATESHLPLTVHSHYQREEILAGFGKGTIASPPGQFREGVFWSDEMHADVFLVTLRKSEADYSLTTMYKDFAISPTMFHWESQSTTSVNSPTGQRYLNHRTRGSHILIFCRAADKNFMGTAPYLFAGSATYVSHTGDRPIAITWRLEHPLPTELYEIAKAVAS